MVVELGGDPAVGGGGKGGGKSGGGGEGELMEHGVRVGDIVRVGEQAGGGARKVCGFCLFSLSFSFGSFCRLVKRVIRFAFWG